MQGMLGVVLHVEEYVIVAVIERKWDWSRLGTVVQESLADIDLSGNPLPRRARTRKNLDQRKMAFNPSFKKQKSTKIELRRKLLKSPTTNQ
jgi:hypothetical protein